jgi:predicted dehydrogenase
MSYQREFAKTLNVAIVGVGSHCYRNLLPTMTFLPVTIRAMCDINKEVLNKTARQYGVPACYTSAKEMYEKEKLDAVFICVGPDKHPQLTCEALDAGLHVWLEKPPAMRAKQVEEMIRHRKDRTVVIGFKKAFMPSIQKVRELVTAKESGRLYSILAEYRMAIPPDGKTVLETNKFTNWLANGCHPLSAMMSVGGKVVAVTVNANAVGAGACMLEFENGAIGNLHLAEGMRGPTERYSFFCENAHITVENSLRVTLHRGIPFDYTRVRNYAPEGRDSGSIVWEPQNTLSTLENKALFTQGVFDEMKHFCDKALEGRPAELGTLEFGLEIMKVYEAALMSNGSRIPISKFD